MRKSAFLKNIEASPMFIAFVCAYYYFDPMQTFRPFAISVALHEAGHIVALWLLKEKIHTLRFCAYGAQIKTQTMPYQKELIVCLSGPSMNFLLMLITKQAAPKFALVNLCLFAYNLLPIYPLDGGRSLRAFLMLSLPVRAAEMIELLISSICATFIIIAACYLTCVWHAGIWPVVLAMSIMLRIADINFLKNRKKQH